MKKAGILLVIIVALSLQAQPPISVTLPDKVTTNDDTGSTTTEERVVEYVDDQTGQITTTVTVTQAVSVQEFNRTVLQTEKDHIPERIATLQGQIDTLNARSAEIDKILEVFN